MRTRRERERESKNNSISTLFQNLNWAHCGIFMLWFIGTVSYGAACVAYLPCARHHDTTCVCVLARHSVYWTLASEIKYIRNLFIVHAKWVIWHSNNSFEKQCEWHRHCTVLIELHFGTPFLVCWICICINIKANNLCTSIHIRRSIDCLQCTYYRIVKPKNIWNWTESKTFDRSHLSLFLPPPLTSICRSKAQSAHRFFVGLVLFLVLHRTLFLITIKLCAILYSHTPL